MKSAYLQQVSDVETAILLQLLEKTSAVPGDVVEFGCYRGDTSLLLQKKLMGTDRQLWIYDSFEGLPKKSSFDSSVAGDSFREGELLVSKKEVVLRFKKAGLKVPRIKKGFFENLDPTIDLPEKISFAFLDGDLYQSILTSLKLVWDKLAEEAIVAIHDYNNPELPGVAKAVDEWCKVHGCKCKQMESLAIIHFSQ